MSLGVNVSKIIRASLGSTTQTLDRKTATLHSGKSTFPYPTAKPTPVLKAPKVRKPKVAPPIVTAPKAESSSGKHVQIIIKLLVPK